MLVCLGCRDVGRREATFLVKCVWKSELEVDEDNIPSDNGMRKAEIHCQEHAHTICTSPTAQTRP